MPISVNRGAGKPRITRGANGGATVHLSPKTMSSSAFDTTMAAKVTDPASAANAALAASFAPRLGESVVMAMGDSITAHGNDTAAGGGPRISGQSYLHWASLLSGGKLRYGGIAATSGYTSAQVLSTHLPTVIAAKPAACVVLCGINDTPLFGSATKTNLTAIWTALANAGITPVLATLTPDNNLSGTAIDPLVAFNHWIRRQARLNGWPLADFYAAGADPSTGQWVSGYNADALHPETPGALAMGQALSDALTGLPFVQNPPELAVWNNWFNVANIVDANALGLTPSGSFTGAPDRWSLVSGTGGTFTTTAMTASEGVGNWFNMQRGGTNLAISTSSYATLVAGHTYLFAARLKTSGLAASGTGVLTLRVKNYSGVGSNEFIRLGDDGGGNGYIKGVDFDGTILSEFTVPSGLSNYSAQVYLDLQTADFTVSIGQTTLVDLTANSIA